ncbi:MULTISPECIES: ESPR-type extended signal peptide-containing protein, partial [Pasteurellaceae]
MNNSYKVIWNTALNRLIVVSELAKGKGKSSAGRQKTAAVSMGRTPFGITALLISGAIAAGIPTSAAADVIYEAGWNNTVKDSCRNDSYSMTVIGIRNTIEQESTTGSENKCYGAVYGTGNYLGANSKGSLVMGINNKVAGSNMVVLGNDISDNSNHNGSVIIGFKSEGRSVSNQNSTTLAGLGTLNFAGSIADQGSYFSVGGTGTSSTDASYMQRMIINVAPGALTESSTDAVNGSQLYVVATALQNNIEEVKSAVDTLSVPSTYKFSIHNNQTDGTASEGKTWSSAESSNEISFGATSDLKVTADAEGNIIYGLSDSAKNSIASAEQAAQTVTNSLSAINSAVTRAETAATAAASSATQSANSATFAASSATEAGKSATAAASSATESANSATSAANSATEADKSATAAESSATEAGNSATAAASFATEAGKSATSAASSATKADSSASTAANSATEANQSATSAESSATKADKSATTAESSATEAGNSAASAASSATEADKSATAAESSATEAGKSATAAASSATKADSSATAAANSAIESANSATAAASS